MNTRENVRLTFDHKVELAIQEILDSNFDLYALPGGGERLRSGVSLGGLRLHDERCVE